MVHSASVYCDAEKVGEHERKETAESTDHRVVRRQEKHDIEVDRLRYEYYTLSKRIPIKYRDNSASESRLAPFSRLIMRLAFFQYFSHTFLLAKGFVFLSMTPIADKLPYCYF